MRRRCRPGDPKRPPEMKNYGDKEEQGTMKKTVAIVLALLLVFGASLAFAGGTKEAAPSGKAMAEESKTATARVRTILADIQAATGKAMAQTQMGAQAVDSGVAQSAGAGEAIKRLASAVDTAAQATLQISVSSQEQLIGMDQVVSAMQSIDQASNQNVTATRQVESAARDLKVLGVQLTETLERYRL